MRTIIIQRSTLRLLGALLILTVAVEVLVVISLNPVVSKPALGPLQFQCNPEVGSDEWDSEFYAYTWICADPEMDDSEMTIIRLRHSGTLEKLPLTESSGSWEMWSGRRDEARRQKREQTGWNRSRAV